MGIVVKNDLPRFLKKLKKYSPNSIEEKLQKIVTQLCEMGEKYARSLYSSRGDKSTTNIQVSWEFTDAQKNKAVISASGEKVAYLEYGTGEKGRGSYDGSLPQHDISFHSNAYNTDVTVNGWTYSYAYQLGLSENKISGSAAQAQMWKTAQYLRSQFVKIAREVVKS